MPRRMWAEGHHAVQSGPGCRRADPGRVCLAQGEFFQAPLPPKADGEMADAPEEEPADAEGEEEEDEVDIAAYDF